MSDRWMIRGLMFANCNCAPGCPCQFNSPTTHGYCEAVGAGVIEEGHYNETRLDGLRFVLLLQWPGEIAEGNGRQQAILDVRADAAQREALRRIVHGENTKPGATAFFVYNSTMSEVLDPVYAPIEVDIQLAARRARIRVPGLVETEGTPIVNPHSGEEHRASIRLPNGFEYTDAEVGKGSSRVNGGIRMTLDGSHAQWHVMHMTQDGVVR